MVVPSGVGTGVENTLSIMSDIVRKRMHSHIICVIKIFLSFFKLESELEYHVIHLPPPPFHR